MAHRLRGCDAFRRVFYKFFFISDDEDNQVNEEQQKGSGLLDRHVINLARANQRALLDILASENTHAKDDKNQDDGRKRQTYGKLRRWAGSTLNGW